MDAIFCGCGAIGSRLIIELAALLDEVMIIDDDIIEESNIGTALFYQYAIGTPKVRWLQEELYNKYGKLIGIRDATLNETICTMSFWRPGMLVIDSFDNPVARRLTITADTLHVGVGEQGNGAVMWDEIYPEPSVDYQRGHNPVCTNQLGRQIIQLTAAVAVGVILEYVETGLRNNYLVQSDMRIIKI